MAAQLSTKLSLDGTQHNEGLRQAAKELSKYRKEVQDTSRQMRKMQGSNAALNDINKMTNQLKSANLGNVFSKFTSSLNLKDLNGQLGMSTQLLSAFGSTMSKINPIVAAASVGAAVYANHLRHDQVAAMDAQMAVTSVTTATDHFAEALARADFSNFLTGLSNQITLAREAAEATEAAARAALLFSNKYKKLSISYEQEMYTARDPQKTEKERKAALERARKLSEEMKKIEITESERAAEAGYKSLQQIIGKGQVGSNMVAWGMGQTSFDLRGKSATREEIDYILNNSSKYLGIVDKMREAWDHVYNVTSGNGKETYEWVREWQRLASDRNNIIAYKIVVDGAEQAQSAIEKINSSYDSDVWAAQRSYMLGRTDYRVNRQEEAERRKREAAARAAAKHVKKYNANADTKEGWQDNIYVLTQNFDKAKTEIERNNIAEEIMLWQKKIDALDFNNNTLSGLEAQLKSVNDILKKTDFNTEEWHNLKKRAEELQLAIENVNLSYITNPRTVREIENNISFLQQKLKGLEPNTNEWRKVTDEIQDLNKKLEIKPTPGSVADYEKQIQEIEEKLQNENLSLPARIQLEDTKRTLASKLNNITDHTIIKATVLPVEQENLMRSYSNASNNIRTIQEQFDMGMIGREEAKKMIDEMNKQIASIGLKPIYVHLETDTEKELNKINSAANSLQSGFGGIDNVVNNVERLNDAIKEDAGLWEQLFGVISTGVSIINAISEVLNTVNTLTELFGTITMASAASDQAAATTEASTIPAKVATSQANEQLAASNIFLAHSYIPFAGVPIAAAFVTQMHAMMLAMAAFADGGIVGGSTTMGDYNVIRANKGEMILNNRQQAKLFNLLDGAMVNSQYGGGEVVFTIKGSTLQGVLHNREDKMNKLK